MAGSVTRNRISTTILSPYKLIPKSKSWKCTGDPLQRARRADPSGVRLHPRLPPPRAEQVVDPQISSQWPVHPCKAPEYAESDLSAKKDRPPAAPHTGWDALNCTPEGSRKQTKICRVGRSDKPPR